MMFYRLPQCEKIYHTRSITIIIERSYRRPLMYNEIGLPTGVNTITILGISSLLLLLPLVC